MNLRPTIAGAPRILPVAILGLALLFVFRSADLWLGFSAAGAEDVATPQTAATAPTAPGSVEDRILSQLSNRRAALDGREAALETREALLLAAEEQLAFRLAELDQKAQSLTALDEAQALREAAQFARLSDAYERMKPRDAARIFEALDADLLGPVASGMRTQSLAGVLGEMNAGEAKELTQLLAQRRTALSSTPQPQ